MSEQLDIGLAEVKSEIERETSAADQQTQRLLQLINTRDKELAAQVSQSTDSLTKAIQATVDQCKSEIETQRSRFKGLERTEETLQRDMKAELSRCETALATELASLRKSFEESLMRQSESRRALESTCMRNQTQIDTTRTQVEAEVKLAILSVKEQYTSLGTELRSQLTTCQSQMETRTRVCEEMTPRLVECEDSIAKQAVAIADMVGDAASEFERTSAAFSLYDAASRR